MTKSYSLGSQNLMIGYVNTLKNLLGLGYCGGLATFVCFLLYYFGVFVMGPYLRARMSYVHLLQPPEGFHNLYPIQKTAYIAFTNKIRLLAILPAFS